MTTQKQESILKAWTLQNRNYVVTGGAAGIGLATVKALLAHKAKIVLLCSRSSCDDIIKELQINYCADQAAKVIHVVCDVSTNEGRKILFEESSKYIAELHGLVNNVGCNIRKPFDEQTEEEYNTIMRTNADSAYFLCQMFRDLLRKAKNAAVVNVSSAAGSRSSGTGIAYAMSKAAINQFTRTLACEWAASGVRVNAVTPWMTMTPMLQQAVGADSSDPFDKVRKWTPMHRLAEPDEIAAPVVFLLMPCSSYLTGQILGVDGGITAQAFDGPCVTKEL